MWLGMSMKAAIDHKRLHHQLFPSELAVETGFDEVCTYITQFQRLSY